MDKKLAKALLDAYNLYSLREFDYDPISSLPEDGVLHVAYTTDEDDERILTAEKKFKKCIFLTFIECIA